MLSRLVPMVLAAAWTLVAQSVDLKPILTRVAEEAEVFQREAVKVVGQEVLEHRSRKPPPRFRPRIGRAAELPPPVTFQTREIVSEYGFAALKEDPSALREFRQVVSVDGKEVSNREKARTRLALGMTSDDDRERRRLLEQFERHGMAGAASDFAQIILLFRPRMIANYDFSFAGEAMLGADPVYAVNYRQKTGADNLRLYQGRRMESIGLSGVLWVRKRDALPLRVTVAATTGEDGREIAYTADVDYRRSAHGLLLPASVRLVKRAGEDLLMENLYQYSDFRRFTVEAEIKFTAEEDVAAPATPQP